MTTKGAPLPLPSMPFGARDVTLKTSLNASMADGVGRLHAEQELCDVTVTVRNEDFLCHKVVLASVSKFFQACFRNKSGHVTIDNEYVSAEAFRIFVDIVYKKLDGVTGIDVANDVLIAAMFLQVQFLQDHCERYLVDTMTPATCLDLWQYASSYDLSILEEGARMMAANRFVEVADLEAFADLPLPFLVMLLSSSRLQIDDEDSLCERILKWVRVDAGVREKFLPELLPFFNFINLSDSYVETLRRASLQFSAIESYLNEALMYKLEKSTKINSLLKSELCARQENRVAEIELESRIVALGGIGINGKSSHRHFRIIEMERGEIMEENDTSTVKQQPQELACLPADPGADFATCVWRNELYISGGSKSPRLFSVYNAGVNRWHTLPDLPQNRQGHAMAGVNWNIFVLGGKETAAQANPETAEDEEASHQVLPSAATENDDDLLQAPRFSARSAESEVQEVWLPSSASGETARDEETSHEVFPAADTEAVSAESLLSEISFFDTKTRAWGTFGQLTEPRRDVTAAVVGHRIYVFGGLNASEQPTSLVECVDTLTGSVYTAGRLPSPTSGARALSDGGTIFVILPEGDVYRTKEHYPLPSDEEAKQEPQAGTVLQTDTDSQQDETNLQDLPALKDKDRKRMAAAFRESRKTVMTADGQDVEVSWEVDDSPRHVDTDRKSEDETTLDTSQPVDCADSDADVMTHIQKEKRAGKTDSRPTVSFQKLKTISKRRHFDACLYKGNITIGGGLDEDGNTLDDVTVTPSWFGSYGMGSLTTDGTGQSHVHLHVLNIPRPTDSATFRFTFRPDKLRDDKCLESHRIRLNKFDWFLKVGNNYGSVSVFLHREGKLCSKWNVSIKYSASLLPFNPERVSNQVYKASSNTYSSGLWRRGWNDFTKMHFITDAAKGFLSERGDVTIQTTITVTTQACTRYFLF